MNYIYNDIIDQYVLVYLDDIIVYGETTDDHEKHYCEVFSWLHTHKLQENYTKCEFGSE